MSTKNSFNLLTDNKLKELRKKMNKMIKENPIITKIVIGTILVIFVITFILVYLNYGQNFWFAFVLSLAVVILFGTMLIKFLVKNYTEEDFDTERNMYISHTGYKGTARELSGEEKKRALVEGDYSMDLDYLGKDRFDHQTLYAFKEQYGQNKNCIVFGSAGSGKSRCYVIQWILQSIRRGESAVVTDTKGTLYNILALCAKRHGYTVRVFNFVSDKLIHSDSFDLMKDLKNNEYYAKKLAKIIVDNYVIKGKKEFWEQEAEPLIVACILLISTDLQRTEKTIYEVAKFLNKTTDLKAFCEEFITKFDHQKNHVAKKYFNNFYGNKEEVRGQIKQAAARITLSFTDDLMSNILGNDSSDLTLPGREKCLYFVNVSDHDKTTELYSSLFFTMQFNKLVDYADTHGNVLPIPVNFILDEFTNLGEIDDYAHLISTLRSRNIAAKMFVQGKEQMEEVYGENNTETILNNCSIHILLKANGMKTAKMFSDRSGEMTYLDVRTQMKNNQEALDILNDEEENAARMHGGRMLFTPHEIFTMDPNYVLVAISSYNVIQMEKLDYELDEHPMLKELKIADNTKHIPTWFANINEAKLQKILRNLGIENIEEHFEEEIYDDIELCEPEDFDRYPPLRNVV